MPKEARIISEIPIVSAAGTGTRVVAAEGDELYHVFRRCNGDEELSPQETFNLAGARETARKVLAGEPLASTSPGTLRILAAAVLVEEAADYALRLATSVPPVTLSDETDREEDALPEDEPPDDPPPANLAQPKSRKRGSAE